MLDRLLTRRIQTVETSSCGRLFDAVASLTGLHQVVSYEGQAAIKLEAVADRCDEVYKFTIQGQEPFEVDVRAMIRSVVEDLEVGTLPGTISAKFHNTLVRIITDGCLQIRESNGLARVCLSGGCFQNMRLLGGAVASLRPCGFEVFFQQRVPSNDGGIALGQAAVAGELLRRGA